MKHFFPEYVGKIRVHSEGGVNLVIKKLIVWAFSLSKDEDGLYVKAIGLLDGDRAAEDGKKEFLMHVNSSHIGQKLCKICNLNQNFAKDTIPLFRRGISFGICLEDMLPPKILLEVKRNGWLENRQIDDPKGWDKHNKSLNEHISELNLSVEESVYLSRVKLKHKEDVCDLVLSLNGEEKTNALRNFEKVLSESILYLCDSREFD
jgi:hypothetical protein